jgi:hypothetical protein
LARRFLSDWAQTEVDVETELEMPHLIKLMTQFTAGLNKGLDEKTVRALITRNGNEPVTRPGLKD